MTWISAITLPPWVYIYIIIISTAVAGSAGVAAAHLYVSDKSITQEW